MKKIRKPRTDFMLPKRNFIIGMGSVLNLRGNYFSYKTSHTGEEADARAIASDWAMVGEDLRTAMNLFKK